MALIIYYILLFLVIFRTGIANASLVGVFLWMKRSRKNLCKRECHEFIVIIPVLREQKVIIKTLMHFLGLEYSLEKLTILLVTTEKEYIENENNEKTTIEIIEEFKNSVNRDLERNVVQSIHYPYSNGKMVDQINYAFSYIRKNFNSNRKDVFCAIYNADSKPEKETLQVVSGLAFADEQKKVFQQSAVYFDNYQDIRKNNNFFAAWYLHSNATLQTRWTFAHEIPRFFRQSFFINRFSKKYFLSHCVGHGLFLRGDILEEITAMPTGTMTEDLFFGYVLSLLGVSINPIPILEIAETPTTFFGAMKQKYVWFFGPFDHINYEKHFKVHFHKKHNPMRSKWFTIQGLIPAFIWLMQGWVVVYLLAYPMITQNGLLFVISIAILTLFGSMSYLFTILMYKKICVPKMDQNINLFDSIMISIFFVPSVILHSIPPIFTICFKIYFNLKGGEPPKPKTER